MAVGKQNPQRQKMINMMYLVLTALLALNVSAEVLNAFQNITDGIQETNEVISRKASNTLTALRDRARDDDKAKPLLDRAVKVKAITADLTEAIDSLKKTMIEETGQPYEEGENAYLATRKIESKKNTDVTTRIMAEKTPKRPVPGGTVIKQRIKEARKKIVNLFVDEEGQINREIFPESTGIADKSYIEDRITFEANDPTKEEDPEMRNYAQYTYGNLPLVAAISLLTKIQSDIVGTEAEIISMLAGNVDATRKTVESVTAMIKAPSSSVAVGENYEAEIFLGAKFATGGTPPVISVNGKELEVNQNGRAVYKTPASSPGEKKGKASIKVKDPKTGEIETYKETFKYNVFEAPATISADEMNVFYIGLKNPVSISVPGYRPRQISANCTGGKMTRSKGKWIVEPSPKAGKATINVSVTGEDGSSKSVGSKEFRIKNVPDPTAYVGAVTQGAVTKTQIGLSSGISVRLDGFPFGGLAFKVVQYEFIYRSRTGRLVREKVNGSRFNQTVKSTIQGAQSGDQIIFTDIKAKGIGSQASGIGTKKLKSGIVLDIK